MRSPSTRRGRLLSAWALSLIGGAIGMAAWAFTILPFVESPMLYGISALGFAGAGVASGAYLARRLLTPNEWRDFTRAPPDDSL